MLRLCFKHESFQGNSRNGFTLVEMLCVIGIIGILAALILPVLVKSKLQAKRAGCINNLQQIGMGFQTFAHDHDDQFPMEVPVADGGAKGLGAAQDFQTLGSALTFPVILICPTDTRTPANSFPQVTDTNISYFVCQDAKVGAADAPLSGDRNLIINLAPASATLSSAALRVAQWTSQGHEYKGNVLYSDNHVDVSKNLGQGGGGSSSGGSPPQGGGSGNPTQPSGGGGGSPGNPGSPGGGSPAKPSSPSAPYPPPPGSPSYPGKGGQANRQQSPAPRTSYNDSSSDITKKKTSTQIAPDPVVVTPEPVIGMSQFDQSFNRFLLNLVLWTYPFLLLLLLLLLVYHLWRKAQQRRDRRAGLE